MEPGSLSHEMTLFLNNKNNEEIKSRETRIENLIATPSGLNELLLILKNNSDAPLKKLACVLLKKSAAKIYLQLEPEQQTSFKSQILSLVATNTQSLTASHLALIADTLGIVITISELKGIQAWPELQLFISTALQSPDSALLYGGVATLQSIMGLDDHMIETEEKLQIFQRLIELTKGTYNPNNDLAYIDSIQLMGALIFSWFDDNPKADMKPLFQEMLLAVQTIKNFPGLLERNKEKYEARLSTLIDEFAGEVGHHNEEFMSSKEMLLEFVVSENILAGSTVGIGLKHSGCFLLTALLDSYHNAFAPKEGNPDIFPGLFQILHKIVLEIEGVKRQQIANQEITPVEYVKEQTERTVVLQVFKCIALEYPHQKIYNLFKEFFNSLTSYPNIQLELLLATSEGFYNFFTREFEIFYQFAIQKADDTSPENYINSLLAIRALSAFAEFITSKTIEKFDPIVRVIAKHLVFQGPIDEARELMLEDIFIALELLVENCEENQLIQYGFELLKKVVSFLQVENASVGLRKNVLRVISAIVSTLEQEKIEEIHKDILAVLSSCMLEDELVAETLVTLGRLALYHLRNNKQKIPRYESLYGEFAKKVATICSRPKEIIEDELLEGAFNFVYMSMMLLEKDVAAYFPPAMVLIIVDFMTGVMNGDRIPVPEEEEEDDHHTDHFSHHHENLAYKSMISGAFKIIGQGFEAYPKQIIEANPNNQAKTIETISALVIAYQLDENEDVRCLAFETSCQFVFGLFRECNVDKSADLLTQFADIATLEKLNLILNRHMNTLKTWFVANHHIITQKKRPIQSLYNPALFEKLAFALNILLEQQFKLNQIDPDLLGSLCVFVEATLKKVENPEYKQQIKNKYGNSKVIPELESKRVPFPEDTQQLQFTFLGAIFDNVFKPILKPSGLEIDPSIHEELVGHIAEIINRMGPKGILFIRSKFGDEFVLKMLTSGPNSNEENLVRNSVFLLAMFFEHSKDSQLLAPHISDFINLLSSKFEKFASNEAIKDNCLAAITRAHMNPVFAPLVANIISAQDLFTKLEEIVPLTGDSLESSAIWKFMLSTVSDNLPAFEARVLQSFKLLSFLLKTVVDEKITIDDEVYDWLLGVLKRNINNPQVQGMIKALDPQSSKKLATVIQ